MRNTNRKRVLLVSGAVILLCMAVIVGTTWALFTDTDTVENHLQAGKLNLTLIRTHLKGVGLHSTTGYLVDFEDPQDVDLSSTDTATKNAFALTGTAQVASGVRDDMKVVPGSKYVAEMQISNNELKSDVAFAYWVEIVYDNQGSNADFAKQVEVIVTTADGTEHKATSDNGLKIGSEQAPIGELAKKGTETFTVSVEFLNLGKVNQSDAKTENDLAQGKPVEFDLVVYAVQVQRP